MKQEITAVEWFFRWLNDNPEATHKEYAEAFEQAKEMEKQQMRDVYMENVLRPFKFDFEEYYNETYNK